MNLNEDITYVIQMNMTDFIYVLVTDSALFDYWFSEGVYGSATARLVTETGVLISDDLPS